MIYYKVATVGNLGGHYTFLCLSKSICPYIWGNSSLSVILGCRSMLSTAEAKEFDSYSPHTLEHGVGPPTPGSEPSHPCLCTQRWRKSIWGSWWGQHDVQWWCSRSRDGSILDSLPVVWPLEALDPYLFSKAVLSVSWDLWDPFLPPFFSFSVRFCCLRIRTLTNTLAL